MWIVYVAWGGQGEITEWDRFPPAAATAWCDPSDCYWMVPGTVNPEML